MVPPGARAAVTYAARAGTASGLNDVLLAAAAFASLGAIVGFANGPDPAMQPPPIPAAELPARRPRFVKTLEYDQTSDPMCRL